MKNLNPVKAKSLAQHILFALLCCAIITPLKAQENLPSGYQLNLNSGPLLYKGFEPLIISSFSPDYNHANTVNEVRYDQNQWLGYGLLMRADFGFINFFADGFYGSWLGQATPSNDGAQALGVEGDLFGAGIGLGLPMLEFYKGESGISLGPEVGISFIQEQFDQEIIWPEYIADNLTNWVGTAGVCMDCQFILGNTRIVANMSWNYLLGDLNGWVMNLGLGFHFPGNNFYTK